MGGSERRKSQRLPIKLDLSCRKVGSETHKLHTGRTANVSSGGLYFETEAGAFKPGNLLEVELSIPPRPGVLEFGGKISGLVRVLRADIIHDSPIGTDLAFGRYGVALQFCQSPKLCI